MALSVLERTREIGPLRAGLLDAAVPAGQLLLTLVALAAVGVAAAAWPARRATRIDVLAAIATQ